MGGIIYLNDMFEDLYNVYSPVPRDDGRHRRSGTNYYKGHSTKDGCSLKAIKARRKKNKNKKTHRR